MKTKNISIAMASLFILIGCEKTIDFKGEITKPLVVVSSFITSDSTIKARLTLSKFFLDESYNHSVIKNADIKYSINGVEKGTLVYLDSGLYTSDYKPNIGDNVKLEIKAPGYSDASAISKIPNRPYIIQVDTSTRILHNYETYSKTTCVSNDCTHSNDTVAELTTKRINFILKFKDNGDEKNYYRLVVRRQSYSTQEQTFGGPPLEVEEYLMYERYLSHFQNIVFGNSQGNSGIEDFLEISGNSHSYDTFSDELINGKEYDLDFIDYITVNYRQIKEHPWNQYSRTGESRTVYYIYLQHISESYYLYAKSASAARNAGDNPFIEPVQIHSNIENGIGILGSYTSSEPWVVEFKH